MSQNVGLIPHDARRLLSHLQKRGAGVTLSTGPWTADAIATAHKRGPHKSATDHTEFVCEEIGDFCRQGYWTVLPFQAVRHVPNLRISPLGVVPQRDRRPRLIVDYTFSKVNHDTVPLAPRESMQFGRALQRLLTTLVYANPVYGPPKLGKIDIADGFYRVSVRTRDIPKLGVALPHTPGSASLVAFPLALPMGWVESPPIFTSLTETACDLANAAMRHPTPSHGVHRLEQLAATAPAPTTTDAPSRPCQRPPPDWARTSAMFGSSAKRPPLATVDVYVDDFLLAAQTKRQQARLLRETLHAIDAVFRPLDAADSPTRKEPTSTKKLHQGDAKWSYRKRMLGWEIDTIEGTITLPAHRLTRLYDLLDGIPQGQRRLSVKRWHQLLGELRSMSVALPGTRGLFSVLQEAFRHSDRHRIRLTPAVHACLADFRALADSLHSRPTRFHELVPTPPSDIGACDACRAGMGGVWFDNAVANSAPILWRTPFPDQVRRELVTAEHRRGRISISDLELAATLAHKAVLAADRHIQERTIWIHGDNRAALAWAQKGSATSTSSRAYLLRLNALHQRHHRYLTRHHYIPGPVNNTLLATVPPAYHHAIRRDWSTLVSTTRSRLSHHRTTAQDTAWRLWTTFCQRLHVDPVLPATRDRLPFLLLFAQRYRSGQISPSGLPVRSRTVEDAVRAVGQAFTGLGAEDPRLTVAGDIDRRLANLLRAWKNEDDPPERVQPLTLQALRRALELADADPSPALLAAADCAALAFFFLLRPGEYSGVPRTRDDLFRLRDVALWSAATQRAPLGPQSLDDVTFVTLTFTRQKNGVRGETIGHARSGDPILCPVLRLLRRIHHFRLHHAPASIPLNAFFHAGAWHYVTPQAVTQLLRAAARTLPASGLRPAQITARSTRPGGAMALLCGGVDSDRLRLIGRWRSDAMYRYLHCQAPDLMAPVAPAMVRGGTFSLQPTTNHPTLLGAPVAPLLPSLLSPLWGTRGSEPPTNGSDAPGGADGNT